MTGQFTTASPLAPNLPLASVLAQVTSYSFSDGVNSYASSDPNARVIEFKVATDAAGAISGWTVELNEWESGTPPHTAGNLVSSMNIIGSGDLVLDSANCSTVGTSLEGIGDSCTSTTGGSVASNLSSPGTWSIAATPAAPAAAAVPALSEWMTLALALLLASAAAVGLRSSRGRHREGSMLMRAAAALALGCALIATVPAEAVASGIEVRTVRFAKGESSANAPRPARR
ncbi:MAG: hypothetical protein IPG84_04990 [Betaproteobacteria bacterium]|nr:hypothetical protein [Betaproteobacteria bacterium]